MHDDVLCIPVESLEKEEEEVSSTPPPPFPFPERSTTEGRVSVATVTSRPAIFPVQSRPTEGEARGTPDETTEVPLPMPPTFPSIVTEEVITRATARPGVSQEWHRENETGWCH